MKNGLKWLYLPVFLVLCYLAWTKGLPLLGIAGLGAEQPAEGPRSTSSAFVRAACEGRFGDLDKLCAPEALELAQQTAQKMRESNVDASGVVLQATKPGLDEPDRRAFQANVKGRTLLVEVKGADPNWKIVNTAFE